jgi:predicted Zn finger-like uncharacterized protein
MQSLATRCPTCQAVFRVVTDQLKLRDGLVRCGACRTVFDATEALVQLEDVVLAAATAAAPPERAVPDSEPQHIASRDEVPQAEAPLAFSTTAELAAAEPAAAEPVNAEPVATEPAVAAPQLVAQSALLSGDEAIPRRRSTLGLAAASIVLLVALAVQTIVLFRTEISANWPQSRSILERLCAPLQCSVDWPRRGDLLAVVGSGLKSLGADDAFELSAVVRNRSATTMALPALELALSDVQDQLILRRVLRPIEYLPRASASSQIAAGLAAGADLEITAPFEVRGQQVAGFVVYPFYP